MKWWFLCWLILSLVSQTLENNQEHFSSICEDCNFECPSIEDIKSYMTEVEDIFQEGNFNRSIDAMEWFEKCLEKTELHETESISSGRFAAVLYKPTDSFNGLNIYANETKALTETAVTDSTVSVQLPSELDIKSRNTVVFCMITCPEKMGGKKGELYDGRLVGLSVREKNISGLHERVNITMNLTKGVNETEKPICMFLNFSTKDYSDSGCRTLWERGQSHITCSCNHLTYFAVLLVSASTSPADKKALGYITLIGCSISLVALVITVVLFFSKRKARSDVSMKVHINLAIALILLNLHFLPSKTVAALSSSGFCLYMALCLHYSLLATFSWMAVEGFHLYLLLVRVFNIYVQKYLLKLSLVAWGIPAVIVALVVIIDRDAYGRVPLDFSDPNSTKICYIGNTTVKMVTTVGVYSLVFVFNLIMLVVTVRRVVSLRHHKEFGQIQRDRAKRDICTLLGVSVLLGITWGLIFFSFGDLTTPGLYAFSILNSLQGFFIFLWFVMSLRKTEYPASKTSSETRNTNS
ncbi:adhesion G-protein coupled receptor G5-like isoform X1 [Thunnus albacares]|uniref:adhesion G-protein coupled receptor G5-like isoform X1 n=1 Tax=Thunnus albacares TaxID=8236 RepID=UPI001CF6648F|nr:adhesion G-protein coupled receptor G5-like isoform X1 [Thunnus albacares]